jgi:hypothetical protein
VFLVSGNREVGLGREKIVEAALLDFCAGADVIHADGAVALFPDKLKSNLEQAFFGIAGSAHRRFVDGSVKLTFANGRSSFLANVYKTFCAFRISE